MLSIDHATLLIHHIEALRLRIDALDAASTGICAGMRLNTLGSEVAYQLLDVIAMDLKARADNLLRLVTESARSTARLPSAGTTPASTGADHRGDRPTPASSACAP